MLKFSQVEVTTTSSATSRYDYHEVLNCSLFYDYLSLFCVPANPEVEPMDQSSADNTENSTSQMGKTVLHPCIYSLQCAGVIFSYPIVAL